MHEVVNNNSTNIHGYADDHQLYVSFSPNSIDEQNAAVSRIENCLKDVKRWMNRFKLKMNDSKTELIIIGTKQQLAKINFSSITIGTTQVTSVSDIRNLGAFFDDSMSMTVHVDKKCSLARHHLYNLFKIRKYLTEDSCKTLTHAFVFSHIDYCNSLLYGLPKCELMKLQRIQNTAARLIFEKPKFSHVTPLLYELHWLPVEYRIEFKILLFVFKCLIGLAPGYLTNMLVPKTNPYSTRSSSSVTLTVPNLSRKTLASRSFGYAAAALWNHLPSGLRNEMSIESFKTKLKTLLFEKAFVNLIEL